MRKYTNPEAHGYLMEAAACRKIGKELDRIIAKYERAVIREADARKTEFELVMGYRSEQEIQDAYGWDFITEAQYKRYVDIFRAGEDALQNPERTVNEIVVSILQRINKDIYRDQLEWQFSALTPEQQAAERKRTEESERAWKKKMAELKERLGRTAESFR